MSSIRQSLLKQLQDELKKAQQRDWEDTIKDKQKTLKALRHLWNIFGQDPLVLEMEKVVLAVVKSYHIDFYKYDLELMESEQRFGWFVGPSGTHFIYLNGDEHHIEIAKEVLLELCREKADREDRDSVRKDHRLYIVDHVSGKLKRLKKFSEILPEFQVVEEASC